MDLVVDSLLVENFRNHAKTKIDLGGQKTFLVTGDNGSGKTSLLEAIHLCLRGKSFKTTKPEILLKHDLDFSRVEIKSGDDKRIFYYDGNLKQKTFSVNGEKKKTITKKQNIPTIVFEGDDLVLFQSAPANRRKYLDGLLGQIYPKYTYALSRYRRALTQRNSLLKQEREPRRDELLMWDKLLVQYGLEILSFRENIVDEINKRIDEVYQKIAGSGDKVKITFTTEILERTEAWWQEELIKNYRKDRCIGRTSFGVQHDDMVFYFNNNKATDMASRGEVRTLVLALKFIEAEIVARVFGEPPIILLDDVFSELDEGRQKALLKNFKDNQIIVTATHPPKGMRADLILK